jgi:hypothetical protein
MKRMLRAHRHRAAGLALVLGLAVTGACGVDLTTSESVSSPDGPQGVADASDVFAADGNDEDVGTPMTTPGKFGHCCVDGLLMSCFCPLTTTCRFGTACSEGGCVDGDGAACEADAGREAG